MLRYKLLTMFLDKKRRGKRKNLSTVRLELGPLSENIKLHKPSDSRPRKPTREKERLIKHLPTIRAVPKGVTHGHLPLLVLAKIVAEELQIKAFLRLVRSSQAREAGKNVAL